MKVRCIENKVSALDKDIFINYTSSYQTFSLIIGKVYTVYALSELEGNIWFCICDENYFLYPMWNPYSLFEVVENRLSRYWVFATTVDSKRKVPLLTFPEWSKNPDEFYADLVEGSGNDKNALLFRKYKELMDLEFPDYSISEIAQIADKEWLICPFCLDAWQSCYDRDGMVTCSNCKKTMHNPRYQSELITNSLQMPTE